ncbi:STAS domain-containing protein [Streptosporangium saharense]|uniref:STAS domain-containing protein n=1 Tax=Streptosporangium saharense TaxID=1706840 RepID=UPI00369BEF30
MSHHAERNEQTGQAQRTFTVETGEGGTPTVVRVRGALDYDTAPVLGAVIDGLWEGLDGGHLVLDLAEMTFCDSVGLSRLITTFTDSQRRGVTLLLAAPKPFLRHVMELTGLSRILPVRDTLDQALAEAREHHAPSR